VYVTNLEKFNLIAKAFSNVSTSESEAVGTSINIIRNLVTELTPNVLVSPTVGKTHNPITSIDKNGWSCPVKQLVV
jgi:hypothetical protein